MLNLQGNGSFEREGVQERLTELLEKIGEAVTKKRLKIHRWRPGRKNGGTRNAEKAKQY